MNKWVFTERAEARWLCQRIRVLDERAAAERQGDNARALWLADLYDLATGRFDEDEALPVPRRVLHLWGVSAAGAALVVGVCERAVTKAANTGRIRGWRCGDGCWALDPGDIYRWRNKRQEEGRSPRDPYEDHDVVRRGIESLLARRDAEPELIEAMHEERGPGNCSPAWGCAECGDENGPLL